MAGEQAIPSDDVQKYNGRITRILVLSSMIAATGGIIFGYDIAISGGVSSMGSFLKKFFPELYSKMMRKESKINSSNNKYCKFDSQLLTIFTSSHYLAGFVASFFASTVTRNFGRKSTILVGGISFLIGAALGGAAYNVYMLILGRVLLGTGVGFTNQSVPLYLSEMAPPQYRGAFNIGFEVCLGLGILSANLINYGTQKIKSGWGWRISLSMAAVPASILTVGTLFYLPETPNILIQHQNNNGLLNATKMLRRIRGCNDVEEELNDLIKANELSSKSSVENPFKNLLKRSKYRPELVMSVAIPFFQQMTGINVVGFYAPILFRTIGLGESASLVSAVVIGVVGTSTTFISLLIVDKFGRKVLFKVGGIQMFVSQILIGGMMMGMDHGKGVLLGKKYYDGILVLILICIYVSGFGLSWGPLGWLVTSEIFSMEIRSAAQSIGVAVGFLFTFVVGQTFLAMLCHFKAGIFFFFGGWIMVMTVFVCLFLPETNNVPIEKMHQIWRDHWFWKKFVDIN